MLGWLRILLVVGVVGVLCTIIFLILRRCCCNHGKRREQVQGGGREMSGARERLQPADAAGMMASKLHHVSLRQLERDGSAKTNYYVFRRGQTSAKPFFAWSDNPSLVTDAVENGWSRFAFTAYSSSQSVRSSAKTLFSPCAAGDQDGAIEVEMSWEVSPGSADFMQKIRLNSGMRKAPSSGVINNSTAAKSAVRAALPLPGPPLGNSAFPQEAYFEITILPADGNARDPVDRVNGGGGKMESDKLKLIREDFNAKVNQEVLIDVGNSHGIGGATKGKVEDFKHSGNDGGRMGGAAVMTVGMAGGGPLPVKFPGSYPGSIGFNSNGSIFLDGIKLVFESETGSWGRPDSVIGCGYNPTQKKVFFTVNSLLVHEIHCKSEEFGAPLYPTMAANGDVAVLVNLGQCAFKYAPANLQRTANPCFIGPLSNSPVLGYEDSKELFSMGRIDELWLNRSTTRNGNTPNHNIMNSNVNRGMEFDEESEGDLFEIVLESSKSPMAMNTT